MASTGFTNHLGRLIGGRYRLLAPIGTGASAHVFLADDVRLGRRVAVKILHPALAGDEAFLRRFRAEARAAAGLNHPHVMAVFDWGEEAEGPYLVSEYLGGGSLRAVLDRGRRLSPSQALVVGLEAGKALAYAHGRGLVHRDIKPANLLFDEEGRLRIADFGLARALAEAAWTEPVSAVLGTARYASPEQVRGVPVDGKADVYSLALVLVEAVTGRVPFAAETTVATLVGRLDTPLVAPPELGPLGPVIARAGRPDPTERLDAMAFAAALQAAATELPSPEPLALADPASNAERTATRLEAGDRIRSDMPMPVNDHPDPRLRSAPPPAARLPSCHVDRAKMPNPVVVLDASLWLDSMLLRTAPAAELLVRLKRVEGCIGLPQAIEAEIKSRVASTIERVAHAVAGLQLLLGPRHELSLSDGGHSQSRVDDRFDELGTLLVRVPIRKTHMIEALDRNLRGMDPILHSQDSFRSQLVWQAILEFSEQSRVLFVTRTVAYYADGQYPKGLTDNLASTARQHAISAAPDLETSISFLAGTKQ